MLKLPLGVLRKYGHTVCYSYTNFGIRILLLNTVFWRLSAILVACISHLLFFFFLTSVQRHISYPAPLEMDIELFPVFWGRTWE